MAQYIDKSDLVKGIKKIIPSEPYPRTSETLYGAEKYGKREMCFKILDLINTLEVKEVDLEKEIEEVKHNYKVDDNRHTSICSADIEWLAKHFFELGLQSQNKGKIVIEEEGTCNTILNRIVGKSWNLICPVHKMNVNNGEKVKIRIIKLE